MCWEGDHIRLVLTHNDSKGLTVGEVSSCLRKIGCRCVQVRNQCRSKLLNIKCVNSMAARLG